MLFCSVCICLGQYVWKIMPGFNILYIIGGFTIYVAGAVSMILAYRHGKLSVLQPINSLNFVFAAIIAVFLLNENFHISNIIGIFLIVSGCIFIGRCN